MLAITIFTLFALLAGTGLSYLALRLRNNDHALVEQINALLPQTQCAQCGYPGCRPYAEAIATNQANINQCPPGGEHTLHALANLLDCEPPPLNIEFGITKETQLAFIDEDTCIGCTLCIQACPVDAILGAARQMHTVITSECTGCELCLPPCPVDCISMIPPKPQTGFYQAIHLINIKANKPAETN